MSTQKSNQLFEMALKIGPSSGPRYHSSDISYILEALNSLSSLSHYARPSHKLPLIAHRTKPTTAHLPPGGVVMRVNRGAWTPGLVLRGGCKGLWRPAYFKPYPPWGIQAPGGDLAFLALIPSHNPWGIQTPREI